MSKILFFINPTFSHYKATFKIAKSFRDKGYKIIYAGSKQFQNIILSQGFEYLFFETNVLPNINEEFNASGNWLKFILKNFLDSSTNSRKQYLDSRIKSLERVTKTVNPNIIFCDAFLSYYYLLLFDYRHKIKFVIIQTMLSSYKDKLIPPLTSNIIPNKTYYYTSLVEFEWVKYFLKRKFIKLFFKLLYFGQDNGTFLRKYIKGKGYSFKEIISNRKAFHFGIKEVTELILSPKELDFPWKTGRKHQIYIGPQIDVSRVDDFDKNYIRVMQNLSEKNNTNIIYCSLGTISTYHFKKCDKFYKKLFAVFRKLKNYQLILSVGDKTDIRLLDNISENIHIFKKVPQLDILSKCHLMISHGGLNSIMECIHFCVPMLLYPLNSDWDQNGNSARAVFHKIGIMGNINNDSIIEIENKINSVINNDLYKININIMRQQYDRYNNKLDLVSIL